MATVPRATHNDRDYERNFVGNRQITMQHFYAISWTDDTESSPIQFAFGYTGHDGIYQCGVVAYSEKTGFNRPRVLWTV